MTDARYDLCLSVILSEAKNLSQVSAMDEKVFSVYILTNAARTVLYIGVTNDLQRRIEEHRTGIIDGFTKKYRCNILVFHEEVGEAYVAISREKELKGWKRFKKNALVSSMNPDWKDLYETIW